MKVAIVLAGLFLTGCGIASIPMPQSDRTAFLVNTDLTFTQWEEGTFQITSSASSPYDRITTKMADTPDGSTYSSIREVDPNASTLGFWDKFTSGAIGLLSGFLIAPAIVP